MTVARAAALGAIVLAVVVVAVLLLRGDGSETYKLHFQTAGQLVKGDEIQVGGRRVGTVQEITLTDNNLAEVTIKVDQDVAPLHEGTTAVIRATSLSGIANRYIALTLGPNSRPPLKEGATLTTEKTTTPVDLDQLFNTLDPETRKNLQNVVQGFAQQYQAKGKQANEATKYFPPALSTTDQLVRAVASDQQAFTDFIVSSSRLVTTVADRRDDLANLVSNANATTAAIASEQTSFQRALTVLPVTLRRGNTTFVNLRSTLTDLDVLVAESKPATKKLAPFLRELRPLVAAARPTIRDLSRLVRLRGPNNDLVDATRKFPALERAARPAFQTSIAALKRSQPVIEYIRPYAPELVGWLRDFGQGANTYDANGHYARIQPIFNAFSLNLGLLNPLSPGQRLAGLQAGAAKRCPGAASQTPVDNSAPFTDGGNLGANDCDASLVPPGP